MDGCLASAAWCAGFCGLGALAGDALGGLLGGSTRASTTRASADARTAAQVLQPLRRAAEAGLFWSTRRRRRAPTQAPTRADAGPTRAAGVAGASLVAGRGDERCPRHAVRESRVCVLCVVSLCAGVRVSGLAPWAPSPRGVAGVAHGRVRASEHGTNST